MLQPSLADFDFWSEGAEIVVVFRPTETHFAFPLLAGGEMSAAPKIRHAQTSDTGRYGGNEVLELAYHVGRQYVLLNRSRGVFRARAENLRIERYTKSAIAKT
jgi:hypothetical protein